jgi:hypothetical protein
VHHVLAWHGGASTCISEGDGIFFMGYFMVMLVSKTV